MIDIAWLCALAIRSVYFLVLMACNFLGYSTLWAHREIKQRGERYDALRKIPAHVAIVNNDQALNKNSLMSLLEIALVENIRRLTIYDAANDYTDLAREIRMFCRSKLSTSKNPVTANDITAHLASKYSLFEPELLIQVGAIPSLSGYPPWCLRVTEIVPVRSLPCNRFAFEECLEAFNKRDIRLGK
ncbi:hypothetical protein ANCDUO_15521 [Ancylostoma duodenale]|uniref:ditrans,polycis-polyprenyl diphosphate synthase [(2E,6E)-farnesyldiphosphate specific] n=1 Tax=Ancylostoma duodenale TaxID=51022 RepID=A0A0C2CDC0_9BILA|nr:hypothetical protein ANCDUO_15521 [Ancylostoma duodenale]